MRLKHIVVALVVIAVGVVAVLSVRRSRTPVVSNPTTIHASRSPAVATRPAKLAALAAEIPADSISPIAAELNASTTTIRRDLEILNQVFVAWETNFPNEGNPVGENDEITAALAGDNRLHFAFISPTNPAINRAGQICDRWGTPFRFHQLSGTKMEIWTAGPDRRFGTADDLRFAPWQNSP